MPILLRPCSVSHIAHISFGMRWWVVGPMTGKTTNSMNAEHQRLSTGVGLAENGSFSRLIRRLPTAKFNL